MSDPRQNHGRIALALPDDNFRTIVHPIGERRQLFRNLRMGFT